MYLVLLFLTDDFPVLHLFCSIRFNTKCTHTHKVILKCWSQRKLPGLKKSQNISLREDSFGEDKAVIRLFGSERGGLLGLNKQ